MRRVFAFYALSGFVSLGYQVAWFRIYVDRFGSTNVTFALVLCNFIAGLGLGAVASRWVTERLSARSGITDKLRLYGLVELLVSAAALLTFAAGLLPPDVWGTFPYVEGELMYEQNLTVVLGKLLIGTLCIFVPCFFMGVTFPLLCDAHRSEGVFPSRLYAWNTMGACAGVVTSEFVLLLTLGHGRMLWLLVGLNVWIGVVFLTGRGGKATVDATPASRGDAGLEAGSSGGFSTGALLLCAILSGLVAGALEGDMFKRVGFVGSQHSALMSFVSFWAIVGIFLGSWTVRFWSSLRLAHIKVAFALAFAYHVVVWMKAYDVRSATYDPGLWSLLVFVGAFVFPPFYLVSLLLPYVCNRLQAGERHLGLAYGLNTLAFCAGLVGFTWIAPGVDVFYAFKVAMVLFGVAVGLLFLVREDRPLAAWKPLAAVVVFGAACAVTPRGFDSDYVRPWLPSKDSPVRAMKSNGAHTTYIVEAPIGDMLYFDNHPMSGTSGRAQVYMRLMAHFPLLCQERPERALLICFGVGNTASAIAGHETIRSIDVVDLNDKVIETAPEFARSNRRVYQDPRVRFIHDDGRSFLRLTDQRYDLITSEPPPPMHGGVYRLYSREYYLDAAAKLTDTGMMTQWLPIFQMPDEAIELAVATFLDVFPHALMFTGFMEEIILVGSNRPIDVGVLERRFTESPGALRDLRRYRMRRPVALLARILQTDGMLRDQYGDGRVISDQRNDFALLFYDQAESHVIRYDPERLLRELGADRLDCGAELRTELTHLGRLTYHVPDFPPLSLESTRELASGRPRLAELDWSVMTELRTEAAMRTGKGETARARGLYEDLLRGSDELPGVEEEYARLLARQGDTAAAVAALQRFLALEPNAIGGHLELARLAEAAGDRGAARVSARAALRLEPDNAEAREILQRLDAPGR